MNQLARQRMATSKAKVYHITYSPSIGVASLYFWGCNFSCRGCIRKKMVSDSHLERCSIPTKKNLHFLTVEGVIDALEKVEPKRILFMGGEPTIDPKLADLTKRVHNKFQSYNVLLTNGFILPPLEHIDEVCVSLKALNDNLHLNFTGKPNRRVLENFVTFHRSKVKLRSESIFIPNYVDCGEIRDIAKFIASVSPNIPYRIDGYIPVPGAPWRQPTPREVWEAVKAAKRYLNNVSYLKGEEKLRWEVVKII